MKVIFLDIDGVLNNQLFYKEQYNLFKSGKGTHKTYPLSEFDPLCVERINRIVDQTKAKIVVSSSWRLEDTNVLQNIFKQVGLPAFFGKTPYIQKDMARGEEIQQYIKEHPFIDKYVILDDDSDMLEEQKPYFVQIKTYYGLTEEDADKVISILGTFESDIKERWNNLLPFNSIDDIPDIPIVYDKELYYDVIVKNLIRCGAIPKDKLEVGKTYIGTCRNASEATWNGAVFIYDRYKFGATYKDETNHFEDFVTTDVFVPIKEK